MTGFDDDEDDEDEDAKRNYDDGDDDDDKIPLPPPPPLLPWKAPRIPPPPSKATPPRKKRRHCGRYSVSDPADIRLRNRKWRRKCWEIRKAKPTAVGRTASMMRMTVIAAVDSEFAVVAAAEDVADVVVDAAAADNDDVADDGWSSICYSKVTIPVSRTIDTWRMNWSRERTTVADDVVVAVVVVDDGEKRNANDVGVDEGVANRGWQ